LFLNFRDFRLEFVDLAFLPASASFSSASDLGELDLAACGPTQGKVAE
jgi:hypothetical protein